jgi:hypothetical protein
MKRQLIVRPEAEADITTAALWYDSRERGVGLDLISEIRSAIVRAQESPDSFTRVRLNPNDPSCSHSPVSLSRFLHCSARCNSRLLPYFTQHDTIEFGRSVRLMQIESRSVDHYLANLVDSGLVHFERATMRLRLQIRTVGVLNHLVHL